MSICKVRDNLTQCATVGSSLLFIISVLFQGDDDHDDGKDEKGSFRL